MGLVAKVGDASQSVNHLLAKLQSPFLLFMRLYVAWVFLRSGLHKISDWETTLVLFEWEYKVPLLHYELAAYLATFGELVFPLFLVLGLGTRINALAISFINVMAVVAYYATLAKGAGLVWHYLYGCMLLTSIIFGGGYFSADQYLKSKFGRQQL